MKKVDFFIVGQPKSGTTALAHFLEQHPEITITIPKEPGYWARDLMNESEEFHGSKNYQTIRNFREYRATFKHAGLGQKVGDASTIYLYSKSSAEEIRKYNPDAKIIIMLRNPVEMIHSLHAQYVNETNEDVTDFKEALKLESYRKKGKRIPKRSHIPSLLLYKQRGLYYGQTKRFFDVFGKDNVAVFLNEDLRNRPKEVYAEILKFIGIKNASYRPRFAGVHESKRPRFSLLNKLLRTNLPKVVARRILGQRAYTSLQKKILEPLVLKETKRGHIDNDTRLKLERHFKKDVLKLERLVGLELSKRWFR